MTNIEIKYYEVMARCLPRIADALERIAEQLEKDNKPAADDGEDEYYNL